MHCNKLISILIYLYTIYIYLLFIIIYFLIAYVAAYAHEEMHNMHSVV